MYKDKEAQKKRNSESAKRKKGMTQQGMTEMVPASYIQGTTKHEFLPERPRFVTLSDGQTLDRLFKPQGTLDPKRNRAMLGANEAYFYRSKRKLSRAESEKLIRS